MVNSPAGALSGLASRRRTAEAFREFCIGVWDTGIGIAPEHLGRIFEEPYPVGWRGDRHGSSQGLGLAIIEHTACLLGHPLTLRFTPGKGSAFAVVLLRAQGSVSRSAPVRKDDGIPGQRRAAWLADPSRAATGLGLSGAWSRTALGSSGPAQP